MKDNNPPFSAGLDSHRYNSDDFGPVDAPFFPSQSNDTAERIAHALEYIACALSVVIDNPTLPPVHEAHAPRATHTGDHQVIQLQATDRHWHDNSWTSH